MFKSKICNLKSTIAILLIAILFLVGCAGAPVKDEKLTSDKVLEQVSLDRHIENRRLWQLIGMGTGALAGTALEPGRGTLVGLLPGLGSASIFTINSDLEEPVYTWSIFTGLIAGAITAGALIVTASNETPGITVISDRGAAAIMSPVVILSGAGVGALIGSFLELFAPNPIEEDKD